MTSEKELLELVDDKKNHKILQCIISHPEEMPSKTELGVMTGTDEPELSNRLDELMDSGLIKRVELEEEKKEQGLPDRFYAVTSEGDEFLKENEVIEPREALKGIYRAIPDKPDEVLEHEKAPRPDTETQEGDS